MDGNVKKVFQKRFYDLLSHKYGILVMLGGAILLTVSAFHFGEAWLEWSTEKYESVFNSFSDNIVGKSFRDRLSLPVPIDVVYTWVNGSDPEMIEQLAALKIVEAQKSNITKQRSAERDTKCTYTNCLPIGVVVLPALPASCSIKDLITIDQKFINVTSMKNLPEDPKVPANLTMLTITVENSASHLVEAFSKGWTYEGRNYTLKAAFYTSDSKLTHGLSVPQVVMISGYPRQYTTEKMQQTVADRVKLAEKADTLDVELFIEKGVALVRTTDTAVLSSLLKDTNFTLENKILGISSVKLVWDLTAVAHVDEIADYRFQDKEELRYSLRSLEQYAPWVRHVYIVTNGQIPHWLNLDNSRISVVTHQEIFANASHLPTFSSPAIEANIHRIPGLSNKFLYLNDDVMFAQPVWPDDFYSHSTGQKLYLSWPVPNCNEGCPSNWINDGYCDKACNASECEWDGDDCKGKSGHVQYGAGFAGGLGNQYGTGETFYCKAGCANNWLADKYCDQACNDLECGFDAGDCGVNNFNQLFDLEFSPGQKMYHIPPGETMAYLNLTKLMGETWKVKAAVHIENKAIRTAAVGNKYKVMVLILQKGFNHSSTNFTLDLQHNVNVTLKINFSITWDTSVEKIKVVDNKTEAKNDTEESQLPSADELDANAFTEIDQDKRQPVPLTRKEILKQPSVDTDLVDLVKYQEKMNASILLMKELQILHAENSQGLLTEKGLNRRLYLLYQLHSAEIKSLKPQIEKAKKEAIVRETDVNKQNKTDGNDETKFEESEGNNKIAQDVDLNHKEAHLMEKKNESILAKTPARADVVPPENQLGADVNVLKSSQSRLVHKPNLTKETNGGTKRDQVVPVMPKNMQQDANPNDKARAGHVPGRKLLASSSNAARQDRRHRVMKNFFRRLKGKAKEIPQDQNEQINEQQFIKLVNVKNSDNFMHRLPWEKPLVERENLTVVEEEDKKEDNSKTDDYSVGGWRGRHLLDAFGDSLRHVNRIYNAVFGYKSRKVPAHMPHMIDKNIMQELQDRFPKEWDVTSSHKIRHPQDMQYAFAYYYYIMGVTEETTPATVFSMTDTDKSRVLSDRELRTFATKVYDLPLYLETLTGMEQIFINCSQHLSDPDPELDLLTEDQKEVYYEKTMPQVTKHLFTHCDAIIKLVSDKFGNSLKYRTTTMDDSDVAFKIIHSNVSKVVGQLDDVRKNPKKFVCLNDNMEHSIGEAATVMAVLQDFYESILPIPSQFELAREYRNRFLHVDELRQWRRYRDWLKFWTHVALITLVSMTVLSFLGDKIENFKKKFMRKTRKKSVMTTSSSSSSSSKIPARQNSLETV